MDMENIKAAIDHFFEENRPDKAEELIIGAITVAMDEQDELSLLQLLNELIGLYRETSRVEDSYVVADQILELIAQILPRESVPYATSLLNVATAYRAGGRLQDALSLYGQVEKIYGTILPADHTLVASLFNNEALLYQELGDFASAKRYLEKALKIVMAAGKAYEEAVSKANLAGTCVQLGDLAAAKQYAREASAIFEEQGVCDGHYAAALSAMGSVCYIEKAYAEGASIFRKAMDLMEKSLGKNAFYERLKENRDACLAMLGSTGAEKGLEICRKYYEFYGKPMLEAQFSEYLPQMAIGLSGEGSDCFGYDDEVSRDHDWGPSFCIWIPRVLYEEIGKQLQEAYMALPDELDGIKRAPVVQGAKRRGVLVLEDYLADFGLLIEEPLKIDWEQVTDASLACLTNGEIWRDDAAILTSYRQVLQQGYPEPVLFCKIAEAASRFSQAGQYNLLRAKAREDRIFASICISDAMREAMKLLYYMNNLFPPHDKWLGKGMESIPGGDEIKRMLEQVCNAQIQENRLCEASARAEESAYGSMGVAEALEQLGAFLAQELYRRDFISDVDAYLDHHAPELLQKAIDAQKDEKELAMEIARQEFAAFDKVDNEGGRASCQNNWPTFSVMRRSQYLTWTKTMQLQYLYDFRREMSLGHNLITEKYGRMMESTAPERYEEIKVHFPLLSEEKKNIIEQIVQLQVAWMEAFAEEYPRLAGQARSIHTYEDNAYNTSYETYLRGEISTYSDKMLELYARFIVEHAQSGRNLAYETMENSCKLYGYESLDAAEEKQEL